MPASVSSTMAEWPSGQWQQTVNLSTGVYHGSNPCSATNADLAQPAEHIHGKDGVFGSNPKIGFRNENNSSGIKVSEFLLCPLELQPHTHRLSAEMFAPHTDCSPELQLPLMHALTQSRPRKKKNSPRFITRGQKRCWLPCLHRYDWLVDLAGNKPRVHRYTVILRDGLRNLTVSVKEQRVVRIVRVVFTVRP